MTVRFTVKCPNLAQYPAKGIEPDFAKTRLSEVLTANPDMKIRYAQRTVEKEIKIQTHINNNYNNRGIELGDILESKLVNCDMTWCNDGCVVISCSNSLAEVEKVIADEGLEIQVDRSTIKHKVRPIDDNDESKGSEEDIDEVFEPLTIGELKKLKSKLVTNEYKSKLALI